MHWNQTQPNTPTFTWNPNQLLRAEWLFLSETGHTAGLLRHLTSADQGEIIVETAVRDALANLEIDGEVLDQSRVEAGIRRHLGLAMDPGQANCQETALAKLTAAVLQGSGNRLTHRTLEEWRKWFLTEDEIAAEKRAAEPPREKTPPTPEEQGKRRELRHFLQWLAIAPDNSARSSPLVRAALAHLWFESIHPLGKNSGPAGRVLAEIALIQGLPNQVFTPLCQVFQKYRHEYHAILDAACRDHDANQWLLWFAAAAVEAGRTARARIEFNLNQSRLLERLRDRICQRQETILLTLFRQPPEDFPAGVSPSQYAQQCNLPPAQVASDMARLAGMQALTRAVRGGRLRYYLNTPSPIVGRVAISDIL